MNTTSILYTVTKRNKGAKWAHVSLYAVQGNELQFVSQYKYQPAANGGPDHEARKAYEAATGRETGERYEVREIDTLR